MESVSSLILNVLNYIGIVAFAISGALKAIDHDMDILGVVVLGFSTALAGGILRDLLVGVVPPTNLTYLPYPITAIVASLAALPLASHVTRRIKLFLYADALGLGAFTAIGAEVAFEHGLNPLGVSILASLTAVGGGVIRDILANEVPMVLTREVYATASIAGGFLFYALALIMPMGQASLVVSIFVFILRAIAIERGWQLPKARRLIRQISRP